MAKKVPQKENIRQIICLDNASWHKAKSFNWHHFEPFFQPAHSPDMNPIEQFWRVMKADFFAGFIAKDREDLIQRLSTALKHYLISPQKIQSTCSTKSLFST